MAVYRSCISSILYPPHKSKTPYPILPPGLISPLMGLLAGLHEILSPSCCGVLVVLSVSHIRVQSRTEHCLACQTCCQMSVMARYPFWEDGIMEFLVPRAYYDGSVGVHSVGDAKYNSLEYSEAAAAIDTSSASILLYISCQYKLRLITYSK